jgi:hypothetical protein
MAVAYESGEPATAEPSAVEAVQSDRYAVL